MFIDDNSEESIKSRIEFLESVVPHINQGREEINSEIDRLYKLFSQKTIEESNGRVVVAKVKRVEYGDHEVAWGPIPELIITVDNPKCECGAKHTSFPNVHSSYCPLA